MLSHGLVVLLSLVAAVFMAIGVVLRQRATIDVPQEHGVSTAMIATLLRRRLWWTGTTAAVAGYVFQALALAQGSLLVVQPLLVSSLLFALPMSARLADRRVTRREWLWAMLLTLALAVFVLMAQTRPGHYGVTPAWTGVGLVVVPLVIGCVVIAARTGGRRRALFIAVAVGLLFGVMAVLTKIVVQELGEVGVAALLSKPVLYVVIVVGIGATVLQQSAFHAGALQTSVPAMLVLEPLIAVLLGAVLLGEEFTVTGSASLLLPIAIIAMATATIALGREEGGQEDQLEAATARCSPVC